jgi:hypothetical protein
VTEEGRQHGELRVRKAGEFSPPEKRAVGLRSGLRDPFLFYLWIEHRSMRPQPDHILTCPMMELIEKLIDRQARSAT